MVETKLQEMLRLRQPPNVAGADTGPGSGSNELIFDRPYPPKDIPLTLKKMEQAGQLNTPNAIANAKIKMEGLKKKVYRKVDYDKGGHPLSD
jgi:hypothetical protein